MKPIPQRVEDFYAFIGRKRLKLINITIKAGLNYHSVRVNLPKNLISSERMTQLEDAAIELADSTSKSVKKTSPYTNKK